MKIFLVLALASILLAGCGDQTAQDGFSVLEQKLDAIEETVGEIEKEWKEPPEEPEAPRFATVEFDPEASSYSAAEAHSMNQLKKEMEALRKDLLKQEEKLSLRCKELWMNLLLKE